MRVIGWLSVVLLLSSCKPYVRQDAEVWSTADTALTLKLVAHQDNHLLATLVMCLAMDLAGSDAKDEKNYAAHSLYSSTEGETCFYALHDTREDDTPYYFTNPRLLPTVADTADHNTSKRRRNLLVSGAVVIGAATAVYMTTRSNILFKKIINLENIKNKMHTINDLQGKGNNVHESVTAEFSNELDKLIGGLPDDELRASLQQLISGKGSTRAVEDVVNAINNLTKDKGRAQQMMMATMLGVGAVSVFAFIDALRNRKPHMVIKPLQHKASALEELFKDNDIVALSNAELWHTLKLLHSHLPARINPDLINLEGLFDASSTR